MKKSLLTATVLLLLCCPPSHGRTYKNPVPGRFPILAWYSIMPDSAITHERYLEMAHAGFNISFSHFSSPGQIAKALNACRGTGVTQMVMAGDAGENTTAIVNRFKHDEMVSGWFLKDEPTVHDYPTLREFRDRILAADTTHLLYLNLNPNYAPLHFLGTGTYREYVQRFVDEVDLGLVSFDHYPILQDDSGLHLRDNFYANLEDVRSVCRETGQPMWAFCLSTAHDPYPVATREMLRLEAFSNLAYGAQCIQYFTYWNPGSTIWNFHTAPISMNGQRTHVYYLVKELNEEIQRLAPVFLDAEVICVGHTGYKIPKGTHPLLTLPAPFRSIDSDGEGLLVSHLRKGDSYYLMVVGRDLLHAQTITVRLNQSVHRIMPSGKSVRYGRKCDSILLPPGDYLLFQWDK